MFTLVFDGDLRKFKGNPMKTETPFGVPVASGIGNAFEMIDNLQKSEYEAHERLEKARAATNAQIRPTITPALDAAIQDEIEHGPKDIMK